MPARLDDLQGPDRGVVTLPRDLAWSGCRAFDLDDEYDRAAMYKIVLEEGQEADQRRLLNWRLLRRDWRNLIQARQVRALWENRFPELRHT
ncbi:MAG: transcriptional regulator [Micromonosporaceae bacterium]|nr:transcriptional regulator [Micromonosporaceae bacterium]